ncbi:MAG: hypothetical protein IT454_23135 [Planctomycetes bacterium]|nr:hypothetical protein [Planctomycetota bacterium]
MKWSSLLLLASPLAISGAALSVRQSTREEPLHPSVKFTASEFEPPALFLLAARAPGKDQVFDVVAEDSHALLHGADARDGRIALEVGVSGSLSIDAAESTMSLDLAIGSDHDEVARAWPALGRIMLRAESVTCRSTAAPGTRMCELRARWSSAGHSHESAVAATWLRMPGNLVRLHAVIGIDELDSRARAGLLSTAPQFAGELAFDLTFKVRR